MLISQFKDPDDGQPEPINGCVTCAHLARFRERAWAAGDGSAVADANARLRRHQSDEAHR